MGTPLLLGTGIFKSYDPDAILYFNQLTGTISNTWKNAVNTLVLSLKSTGNWSELDRFWIFATENQQNARISLVNPTSTPITEVNSPSWTINSGYMGNTTTSYLNTNFNPATQSIKFTQNNASHGLYCITNQAINRTDAGVFSVTDNTMTTRFNDNKVYVGCNGVAESSILVSDSLGFYSATRTNSTQQSIYKNGVSILTANVNSGAISNGNDFVCCYNNAGVPALFSGKRFSIRYWGSGNINQSTFYTSIQAFATTIGFNV